MPSIDWLETLFMSRVAMLILLSIAVFWLARNNRRKDLLIESLTTRLIRLLELRDERDAGTVEKLAADPETAPPESGGDAGLG